MVGFSWFPLFQLFNSVCNGVVVSSFSASASAPAVTREERRVAIGREVFISLDSKIKFAFISWESPTAWLVSCGCLECLVVLVAWRQYSCHNHQLGPRWVFWFYWWDLFSLAFMGCLRGVWLFFFHSGDGGN